MAFTGISYGLLLPGNLSLAIGRVGISVRPLPTPTLKSSWRHLLVCLPNREIFNSQLLCTDKKYQCFNTYSHHSTAKAWLLSYVFDYLLSLPPSLECIIVGLIAIYLVSEIFSCCVSSVNEWTCYCRSHLTIHSLCQRLCVFCAHRNSGVFHDDLELW